MAPAWTTRGKGALAMCAGAGLVFALFHAGAPPEHVDEAEDVAPGADAPQPTAAARCRAAGAHIDGKLLARLLERLESRRSHAARCATLNQLAVHAELGDAPIIVLEKYARRDYPMRVRVCALQALGYAVSPAAVATLLQLTRAIDAPLRDALVHALATREEAAARAGLIALVRDPTSALRVPAVVALAQLGVSEAVTLIEALLEEPGIHPSRLVVALGESGDPRALGVLQRQLERTDVLFADEITAALGELGTPDSTRMLVSMTQRAGADASAIYRALARSADPGAQQALFSAADSGKTSALDALAELDGPEARAWMLRALDSDDARRLQAATTYFSAHVDERAISGLSKLAQSDTRTQARAALRALGSIGGQAASNALEELAASPGPLQGLALSTLAQQPEAGERARALALNLLDQGDEAPSNALNILARDASPEAHAALLRAARGGAQQSQRAIWLLAKRDDPETVSVLSEIARTDDAPNRISALSALAEGGSPQAADVMRDALRASDPAVRAEAVSRFGAIEAPDVEQAMLAASRDTAPEVAAAAVVQLGELATPSALDRLAHIASGSDDTVARQALQNLASAAPERAVVVADALIQSGDVSGLQTALSAVASLPMEATARVLERGLTSADTDVVSEALSQLQSSECDPSAFTETLERLARDARLSGDVREQARNLLLDPEIETTPAQQAQP